LRALVHGRGCRHFLRPQSCLLREQAIPKSYQITADRGCRCLFVLFLIQHVLAPFGLVVAGSTRQIYKWLVQRCSPHCQKREKNAIPAFASSRRFRLRPPGQSDDRRQYSCARNDWIFWKFSPPRNSEHPTSHVRTHMTTELN
jgi:hypothetical protein